MLQHDKFRKDFVRIPILKGPTFKKEMRFQNIITKRGYVYILSNKRRNVLYIGVTSDLKKRVWKHRNNLGSNFTKKYNLKYLIYFESFSHIEDAIDREKQLKFGGEIGNIISLKRRTLI